MLGKKRVDRKRPLFLMAEIGYNSVKAFLIINMKGMIIRWQDQGSGKEYVRCLN